MSDSVWPPRRQPTRLSRLWDSPGKKTGVGCHFLLQCMKVKSESEADQSYLTLSNPMDCSLPGSSHGIFQARVLEWGAFSVSFPSVLKYYDGLELRSIFNGFRLLLLTPWSYMPAASSHGYNPTGLFLGGGETGESVHCGPSLAYYMPEEVKWSEFAQSCPTLCDPMDCSLPGSSVHRIFQARVLEWVANA